ncbi:MAG: hydrolase [Cytophagaceae bacterium]|nr:hydrolase [Cytophagaceae bacterium]|tara:strand:- start:1731 stop:2555 length:825 start_codon:yes stop_codon:yes gene_type:complete
MKTLRYRSSDQEVYFLEEILKELGYDINISTYFDLGTDAAVKDFQAKNNLVIDGIVGIKTWAKLLTAKQNVLSFGDKLLGEDDLKEFAHQYDVELAAVKAVNEVESNGKGFLIDGRPRILFEGHIFWRQLEKRGISPVEKINEFTQDVLYKSWTKKYYKGGSAEYERLEKAAGMSDEDAVHDAAYASASYGSFQIMGFNYEPLGYLSIDAFVAEMYEHERNHLKAFGKFLEVNNLIPSLRAKDWHRFAKGYNGPAYESNNYHTKMERAYNRYSA